MPVDIRSLPAPSVVETLSFEALRTSGIARAQELFDAAGIDYDVGNLETDPVVILIEENVYREIILRARANQAAVAQLIAFASGSTLDHVAALFDVARLTGESDARLQERVVLKNADRNSAGSEERYRYLAMTASLRVKDAVVYTVGRSPIIHISILSTDNNGVADQALLDQVAAAVDSKMVNDTIEVESSVQQVINVTAQIWLLPDAVQAQTLAGAEAALRAAWAIDGKLGRDWDASYATKHLMVAGVHRLANVTPAGLTTIDFNKVATIGTVTLTFQGRGY